MAEINKNGRVSLEQREIMLQFMKTHPALGTNKFTAPDGVKHKARLLNDLTEQLNSCSSGTTKTSDKWLKSWQDWCSDVKSKAAKIRRHVNGTGGGPALKIALTPIEEELLAYLGEVAVSRHAVVDILDVPLEPTNVEAAPVLWDTVLEPEATDNVSASQETVTVPVPKPSPTDSCGSSSSVQSSARKRRRTITCSTESVGEEDSKLLSLALDQLAIMSEQLNVSKRTMEISELQLQLSREMYDLQKEQGNRYRAALES